MTTLPVNELKHAVVLAIQGLNLVEVRRLGGKKCSFLFGDPEKARAVINDFNLGKLKIDPRDIFRELSNFKTLIYSNYSLTNPEDEGQ